MLIRHQLQVRLNNQCISNNYVLSISYGSSPDYFHEGRTGACYQAVSTICEGSAFVDLAIRH